MKKAIRIHISGYIFSIDEDAYSVLKEWLDSISNQYLNEQDGKEIIDDIEMRVAELFKEKVGNEGAVSLIEVNSIIKTMGQPEEFEEDTTIEDSGNKETSSIKTPPKPKQENKKTNREKRLYRDEENRVIAGVCSGLDKYLGIDVVFIRLAFVLALVGGFGVIAYLILWAVTPEAKTVSQKLEMMGEPVNISNIEKAIKDEIEFFKEKFSHKKWRKRRSRRRR